MRTRKRKQVSEKSLELNVCAEILQIIRTSFPRAVWLGLTQMQERRLGLDELIRNVGPGRHLMLQFKAPWATSKPNYLYKFGLEDQQYGRLRRLAQRYPSGVYYVFPLYSTWRKVDQDAPDLTRDTWLVPVARIPVNQAAGKQQHKVFFQKSLNAPSVAAVVDDPEEITDLLNAHEFFGSDSVATGNRSVPSEAVREWFQAETLGQDAAVRFRGLNSIFVPSSQR